MHLAGVPVRQQYALRVRQRHQPSPCQAVHGTDAAILTVYEQLASAAKVEGSLTVQRCTGTGGLGLVSPMRQPAGAVLMRVPRSVAIVLDYDKGLTMPPARWPRLRGGASSSVEPLPWDILQALALIDGLAGDGGEFWQAYTDSLLPGPERLTLPMCWEAPRLAQLQHADIAEAALAQQERLSGLLPELMEPLAPDVPSWLQWAFACVRSRAFRAGPDAFAFVPFLDLANHAAAPAVGPPGQQGAAPAAGEGGMPTANADFRVAEAGAAGEACFELFALREVQPGEEVTICYSGPEGYPNQRFMAQYGFVPRGGNPADRVKLQLEREHSAAPLELARLQDLLGDGLFLGALRGADPYLFAALKSLPLVDREAEAGGGGGGDTGAQQQTAAQAQRRAQDVSGGASCAGADASVRTAQALLRQVEQQIVEGPTSLEADQELLEGPRGPALLADDPRQAAAVAYRVERKRLLAKTAALLRAYSRGAALR